MRTLYTDHVPERLREEIRGRAGDVGTATRRAARSAGDRVRTTAADRLVKAGKAVEPDRSGGRPRGLYLLVVPVVVAGVVWVVRAVRTRSAAGEDATATAESIGAGETERPASGNGHGRPDRATERQAAAERSRAG